MSHDATKVLMGTAQSNILEVDNKAGNILAGLRVCQKSDGTISIAIADGTAFGISVGAGLGREGRTAIARRGLRVPVLLTAAFTPVVGAQVFISDTTGKAGASGAGFTGINASYSTLEDGNASTVMTGMQEDLTTANVALIDFAGGV